MAEYFSVSPEMIRKWRFLRGNVGRACAALIFILRERFPWSHHLIMKFMNLTEKSGISYNLRRVTSDNACMKDVMEIMGK
jgi:hypothetical protein